MCGGVGGAGDRGRDRVSLQKTHQLSRNSPYQEEQPSTGTSDKEHGAEHGRGAGKWRSGCRESKLRNH